MILFTPAFPGGPGQPGEGPAHLLKNPRLHHPCPGGGVQQGGEGSTVQGEPGGRGDLGAEGPHAELDTERTSFDQRWF